MLGGQGWPLRKWQVKRPRAGAMQMSWEENVPGQGSSAPEHLRRCCA